MAGHGKGARGKRGQGGGSTSYVSTVSIVAFVSFCLLGVWMLAPSSMTTAKASSRLARSGSTVAIRPFLREPHPTFDDERGDGNGAGEEGADEDELSQKVGERGREGEEQIGFEEIKERQQMEESGREGEEQIGFKEIKERPQEEKEPAPQNEEERLRQESQENRNLDGGEGEHNLDGGAEEESRKQTEEQQQQDDGQSADHHRISVEEQQMEAGGENENQESTQEQQSDEQNAEDHGSSGDDQQVEAVGENQDPWPQQEQQEGADGDQSQTEQEGENQQVEQQEGADGDQSQTEQEGEIQQADLEGGDSETQQAEQQEEADGDQSQTEQEGENQQGDLEGGDSQNQQQIEQTSSINGSEESQQQNDENLSDSNAGESLLEGGRSEVSNESDGNKSLWATQADQSDDEKERRKEAEESQDNGGGIVQSLPGYNWELCNVTAGADYIPCLDNTEAIKKLHSFKHYRHRERHCPEESPTCLVPLPKGYRRSIEWPMSRDRIWYNNIPHTKLVEVKGHQNWVKVDGDYLVFPGGGTQFIHGARHYIDFIQQSVHDIAWGKHTRVILDVGCGVASFGGYLFERDVLAMSFAPKDEHEAQVQFALERGIPAISAVMGSKRLPFPSRVFDLVHCARCRVPWHADGGMLLLELNRVLRPGGYFVWSATPVYQKLKEDVKIWEAMSSLTLSMCWDLISTKTDKLNGVAVAIYRKPTTNECYENRKHHSPPMCNGDDDPNAAWYIPMTVCMHMVPIDAPQRGSQWPERWPRRVAVHPYWLNSSQMGIYGKPAPDDFRSDYEHWKRVVTKLYLNGLGIKWSKVRNVMDMRAVYGGFAAALKDMKVWVMNVVNIDAPDTLPIIYERGLIGIYHDWCESFSTYPRSYDLLHADHLFSKLKNRCDIMPVMVEVDRIVRPGGTLIVRDENTVVSEVENLLKSLHWEIRLTFLKGQEGMLCAEKSDWRPEKYTDSP